MPRAARIKSNSGIYHIMLRGINQQNIFEDDEDKDKFLDVLRECKVISGYQVYGYCLMGNHIHLLIKFESEQPELVFKRIGGRYVYWYNMKYKRIGHLFQDRFKSEPVNDEAYLLTVLRYIHQNPVKAGLCKSVENYKYSSYREYVGRAYLVDIDFVYEIINKEDFSKFNNEQNSDSCMEITEEVRFRLTDEQVKKEIKNLTNCDNIVEVQALSNGMKSRLVCKLYSCGGSVRQISRLTGISKGIVEKCLKKV